MDLMMGCAPCYHGVLEAVLAGRPAFEIEPSLQELSRDDRQTVLCTVCSIHNEIASNCLEYAHEVSALLTSHCPLYVNGIATCLLDYEPRGCAF